MEELRAGLRRELREDLHEHLHRARAVRVPPARLELGPQVLLRPLDLAPVQKDRVAKDALELPSTLNV